MPSVKTTGVGGDRGYDGGKTVKGRKRHLLVDTEKISAEPIQDDGGLWQTLLFAFGPALLLLGGYIWLYRRAQRQSGVGGALTGVGRSRARRYDREQGTRVTFDDVAGIEEEAGPHHGTL